MGVAKKKRRSMSKKKPQPKKVKAPSQPKKSAAPRTDSAWMFELLAVLFGAVGLFLLTSILSYQFEHFRGSLGSGPGNLMGPLGDIVSTLGVGFLGWGTLLPVALLLGLSAVCWYASSWHEEDLALTVESRGLFVVGLFGVILFGTVLLSILFGRAGGGSLGNLLSVPLLQLLNVTGASLVVCGALLLSVAFTLQRSTGPLLYRFAKVLLVGARFALLRIPFTATIRLSRFLNTLLIRLTGWCALPERERKEDLEEAVKDDYSDLPPPRVRKNVIPEEVEEEEEEFEEAPPVVVKRRDKPQNQKSRGFFSGRQKKKKTLTNKVTAEYHPPDLQLLTAGEISQSAEDDDILLKKSRVIESKLRDFGIAGRVTEVHPGPVITLFEFEPAPGVKVGKIASLQDDLSMSLRASSIRIIAPIPRKGTVGIEVPNKQHDIVRLRDLLESEVFTRAESTLTLPLGKDTYGDPVVADIATMPHLLIAGATGTGKSVCINTLLVSLLYRASPADLGLILIDPKILELSIYEGIPHLKVPVVTVPKQAKAVLEWAVKEMDKRYRLMQQHGVRNIDGYNRLVRGEDEEGEVKKEAPPLPEDIIDLSDDEVVEEGTIEDGDDSEGETRNPRSIIFEELEPLSKVVIVIDELADLMLSVGRDIEDLIARLAQKARAAGIHLVVATQRPSVDVITGLIKANFPARLSFRVSSRIDSRTILDSMGAEKLLGRGDMLVMLPGAVHVKRVHGAFVSDGEVRRVVEALKENNVVEYDEEILDVCEKALIEDSNSSGDSGGGDEYDPLYDEAVNLVVEKGQASTSMIQRQFRIGYNRAARIIDCMESEGVVGPMDGAKPREVLLRPGEGYGDDQF